MKTPALLLGLLACAFSALAASTPLGTNQDAAKKGAACDTKDVEDALWCSKCKKLREKEQVDGEKCKECQTVAEKIKVCVKKWVPSCGMHQQVPHTKPCCGSKMCCKIQTNKSPLVFKCEGCGQTARDEKEIKHDAKNHAPLRRAQGQRSFAQTVWHQLQHLFRRARDDGHHDQRECHAAGKRRLADEGHAACRHRPPVLAEHRP